eukprot:TRINITY_DN1974_c0_g1_i5.p1 TRINITY_DN1974_c0_g1~~TRINITY_DN1974_c0_g1_i5.p1  ORF type:complete len:529 (+),score=126.37 TRINITY_DN1974_c0_g1_i5:581-2167(+)
MMEVMLYDKSDGSVQMVESNRLKFMSHLKNFEDEIVNNNIRFSEDTIESTPTSSEVVYKNELTAQELMSRCEKHDLQDIIDKSSLPSFKQTFSGYKPKKDTNKFSFFGFTWDMVFPDDDYIRRKFVERVFTEITTLTKISNDSLKVVNITREGGLTIIFSVKIGFVDINGMMNTVDSEYLRGHIHRIHNKLNSSGQTLIGIANMDKDPTPDTILKRDFPRILTLDGGGTRGVVALSVLQRIEDELNNPDRELPPGLKLGQVFDWIVGTSTGGIISLALRTNMCVKDIKTVYIELCDTIFPKSIMHKAIGVYELLYGGWYPVSSLENAIKKQFAGIKTIGSIPKSMGVVTTNITTKKAYLLTNSEDSHPLLTPVEALRFTSAAPGYFRPMKWGNQVWIDGGIGNNNPTDIFLCSFDIPKKSSKKPVVLSVGTGKPPEKKVTESTKSFWGSFFLSLVDDATSTEKIHHKILESGIVDQYRYYRIQPQLQVTANLDETNKTVLNSFSNIEWEKTFPSPKEVVDALLEPQYL